MSLTATLGTLQVVLKGSAAPLQSAMNKAGAIVKKTAQTIERHAKRAAVAVSAIATTSSYAYAKFEKQLASVSTMLNQQTMKYLPAYDQALRSMAMSFGQSTQTLSKGLYDILSASVDARKAIDVLKVSVKAGVAGMSDAGVAADAITTLLNAYGLSADKAASISDLLFAIVKRGKTTFGELAPNIGKVASVAAVAGLSLEQMGAALATMTRAGLQTDIAVTSLKAVINTFLAPQEESIKVARMYGFELNAATLQAEGLTGVLQKLANVAKEDLAAIVPNVRAITGFAAALKQAKEMVSDYNFMLNRTGLTQEAFGKMANTLSYAFDRIKQAVVITSVQIGRRLAPGLLQISKWIISNQPKIEYWATYFTDRFIFVKDILWDFAQWLMKDFTGAMSTSFDTIVTLFKAAGESLIVLSVHIGKSIKEGLLMYLENVWDGFCRDFHAGFNKVAQKGVFGIAGAAAAKAFPVDEGSKAPPVHSTQQIIDAMTGQMTDGLAGSLGQIWLDAVKHIEQTNPLFDSVLNRVEELKEKDRERLNILNKTTQVIERQTKAIQKQTTVQQKSVAPRIKLNAESLKRLKIYFEEAQWLGKLDNYRTKSLFQARKIAEALHPKDLVARARMMEVLTGKIDNMVSLAKELKEAIKTPRERMVEMEKQITLLVRAGLLTAQEGGKALALKSKEILGSVTGGSVQEIGGSISAVGLAGGGKLNPMINEQRMTNQLLRDIKRQQQEEESY